MLPQYEYLYEYLLQYGTSTIRLDTKQNKVVSGCMGVYPRSRYWDIQRSPDPLLHLSGVGGLVSLNPQVFIDPHWFCQKYIADPPLVLSQIEYWPDPLVGSTGGVGRTKWWKKGERDGIVG